ncbi:hypothetical protein LXA43DRAFT_1060677 [Ganoderma leucocontextum]|nr:hypothetical protein LXA43DRAFT_1060677 [Ganoderma leucocontextum]
MPQRKQPDPKLGAESNGIGRALRELRGTTETASPPLSRATGGPSSGKKRSEEPEAREAEREDRPNGRNWKMMNRAGGGGNLNAEALASRCPESERIANVDGVRKPA